MGFVPKTWLSSQLNRKKNQYSFNKIKRKCWKAGRKEGEWEKGFFIACKVGLLTIK